VKNRTAGLLRRISRHRRGEIGIRRAVEAAIRDHHAERRQHVEIAPEPLAADRVEDEVGVMPL
jgi:hypothetical protein